MNKQDSDTKPHATDDPGGPGLVVGIGASAGGLEAFGDFLAHLPCDSGMAFVLVQHLDPTHESQLVDLLGRHTSLPIAAAEDGRRLAADHVYVIPPDATLRLEDGRLRVERPAPPRADRRPIDTFFESLAADQGDNAVCIVLSGTGTDGTRGVKAIKSCGGLALAQAETDHQAMSGMPQSAVTTGQVDYVLPATDMARTLMDYRGHLSAAAQHKNGDGERHDAVDYLGEINELLRARTGHDFRDYKDNTRTRRIQRRMQVRQIDAMADYIECLRAEPGERDALFREFLICVTQFFRDHEAWEALAETALPDLLADKTAADSLRIWVPGCATGEEAYSAAILFAEALENRSNAPALQIFATDIDESASHAARKGWFPPPMTGLSSARLGRWFAPDQGGYRPVKAIRESCIFSAHDLGRDPPFSRLDLIICRNLLIYMKADLQERILRKFHYGLRPEGYLFLGLSENVEHNSKLFATIDKKQRLFQRCETAEPAPADFSRPAPARIPSAAENDKSRSTEQQIDQDARQAVARHCPAYLVVDRQYEILRFSGGEAGAYLEPSDGAASFNLFQIVKRALRPAVRSAVQQVFAEHRSVIQDELALRVDGQQRVITLIVEPISANNAHGELCVVAFRDAGPAAVSPASAAPERAGTQTSELEQELHVTRTQLRAANDELATTQAEARAATEEYQSVNEELQSSNEELETSKEEMQSINEELQTVNTELASKNEHLTRLNSDLQNLLESTQIATIFLDRRLHIKNFTPGVAELFHLRGTDIGRPITDIVSRLDYDTLEHDAETVLRKLTPIEREVRVDDGATFVMNIRLYRTVTQVIDGVVVTFFDISERKHYEAQRAWLASIVESSHDAIISQNPNGEITSWNAAAERIFGYQADEAMGRSLHQLLSRDQADETPAQLEQRQYESNSAPVEVVRLRKGGQPIDVALTVSPVVDQQGVTIATSIIARDISERIVQESHRDLLVRELSHRVKNTLATVQSIMTQTLDRTNSLEAFRETFSKRLQALADTHSLLSHSEWGGVELRALIEKELRPYAESSRDIRGVTVWLAPPKAIALGLALHELATNAAKYGALSVAEGRVAVAWERAEAETQTLLRLRWTEHDGPPVQAPADKGFGLRLIQDGLAHQLEARVTLDFEHDGLRCAIELPLDTEDAAPTERGKHESDG